MRKISAIAMLKILSIFTMKCFILSLLKTKCERSFYSVNIYLSPILAIKICIPSIFEKSLLIYHDCEKGNQSPPLEIVLSGAKPDFASAFSDAESFAESISLPIANSQDHVRFK
jgi:hypothetical protein